MDNRNEVIDLTSSPAPARMHLLRHRSSFDDIVIEINSDDESCGRLRYRNNQIIANYKKKKSIFRSASVGYKNNDPKDAKTRNNQCEDNRNLSNNWGDCPICWDKLGTNPLASTKCGHVYCMKCLEQCLKREKKCPTCRQILKCCSAYHPLYLN